MKKLIFFLLLLLSTASLSAQSEQPSDSIRHLPSTVKQYGDFLIDMGLFIAAPPKLPKYKFELPDASKDYNRIFSLNPDVIMTQGLSNVFTPPFHTDSVGADTISSRLRNSSRWDRLN